MFKKVIPIVLVLCLIFGISAMAENANEVADGSVAGATQQMPRGERPGGGRGNMGMPPSGDMNGRTPPNMPNGEMPSGDFAPPEGFAPPDGEFAPVQNRSELSSAKSKEGNTAETTAPKTDAPTTDAPKTDAGITEEQQNSPENTEESGQTQNESSQLVSDMPEGMGRFPGSMQNGQNAAEKPTGFFGFVKTYSTPITSVVLLGPAFIFVIFYRRKNY